MIEDRLHRRQRFTLTQQIFSTVPRDDDAGVATLDPPTPFGQTPPTPPEPEEEPTLEPTEEPQSEKPNLSDARSFLTELHPSGFGELLVTDVWLPPVPKPGTQEEPVDRQQMWRKRKEYRELNLLREKPAASFDARTERFWKQVNEALTHAPDAIVDPYTDFAASFADAHYEQMGDYLREAKEYGYTAESLCRYGRACLALGRLKSARSTLKKAVKEDPMLGEAWWNLGIAHLFARAHPEASEAFTQALDLSPGDYRIETALGLSRFHERKYDEAEEHLRRTAGPRGPRAAARSLLACSLRQQGKWDDARIELNFLKNGGSARWATVAEQCQDCVVRGEEQTSTAVFSRRRGIAMVKSLATAGAGGAYILYSLAENWFRDNLKWASIPLFLIAMALGRSLKSVASPGASNEFGNYEQGLPCWQATTWMKPRRSEF